MFKAEFILLQTVIERFKAKSMPEVHIIFLNTKVQMVTPQTGMPTCNLDAFAGAEAKWGLFRDAAF